MKSPTLRDTRVVYCGEKLETRWLCASTRSGLGGDGKPWRIGTEVYGDRDILPRDVISRKLSVPNAERISFIRHALRAGFTLSKIYRLTKIDRWFLAQIKEIVDFEEELAGAKN
jgi:carbamoyl-phosphate synthase large subunit